MALKFRSSAFTATPTQPTQGDRDGESRAARPQGPGSGDSGAPCMATGPPGHAGGGGGAIFSGSAIPGQRQRPISPLPARAPKSNNHRESGKTEGSRQQGRSSRAESVSRWFQFGGTWRLQKPPGSGPAHRPTFLRFPLTRPCAHAHVACRPPSPPPVALRRGTAVVPLKLLAGPPCAHTSQHHRALLANNQSSMYGEATQLRDVEGTVHVLNVPPNPDVLMSLKLG